MTLRNLTTEQTYVLEEVVRTLAQAFEAARAKVEAAGIRGEEETLFCTRCSCDAFVHGRGTLNCARSGCGHTWGRHNVW